MYGRVIIYKTREGNAEEPVAIAPSYRDAVEWIQEQTNQDLYRTAKVNLTPWDVLEI